MAIFIEQKEKGIHVGTYERLWIFKDEDGTIVGEANEHDYRNAMEAVERFDYPDHFLVYFQTGDGVLHDCVDEHEPCDFPDATLEEDE